MVKCDNRQLQKTSFGLELDFKSTEVRRAVGRRMVMRILGRDGAGLADRVGFPVIGVYQMRLLNRILTVAFALSGRGVALADPVDYVRDVRPILQKHCYSCHGADKQKGNLRLDIKSEAFKGGESYGPSVVAKKAGQSPLITFIADEKADLRMPPEGPRLSVAEISLLSRWIDEGAMWPDGVDLAKLVDKRDHWSLKPVQKPGLPDIQNESWLRGSIDRFVLARLESAGLTPSSETDRVIWLRRVSFDLIGLPPSAEDVESFVADNRADAFERVVENLLASPHYGERWAQHWLDVVRYADTHGFEVNTERPNAWPYRDYVIRAFNENTPYDRFVREQIGGDALQQETATGFLITASVLLPGQIGKDEPSIRLARQDSLDEIVSNISQTFLGLSVGCARCHDHKFDPISQRDYYAMQAFVAGVEYQDRELHTPEAVALRTKSAEIKSQIARIDDQLLRLVPLAKSGAPRAAVNARLNSDRFQPVSAKRIRFTILATNNLEPCLDELEAFDLTAANVALASQGTSVRSSGDTTVPNRHELRQVNDGRYGNSKSWMSNEVGKGWVELEFPQEQKIDLVIWGRDREGQFNDRLPTEYRIEVATSTGDWQVVADSSDRTPWTADSKKAPVFSAQGLSDADSKTASRLLKEKQALESLRDKTAIGQTAFAGRFRKPDLIRLLNRGDPEQPKDEVNAAVLSALGDLNLPAETDEQQRRLRLADWIVDPQNPLTARVMVNRIWQGHFGIGIVDTASDFGRMGTRPSHPELLDWLASEFVRSGWSVKALHRLIVLSATYRQSSRNLPEAAAIDADSRLLWRYPPRRLDGETIRDAMLSVSDRLNPTMGGPGFNLFNQRGGLSGFTPVESFGPEGLRRKIYAHVVRRERDAVFGAFDCPDGGQSTAKRRESTTPIQALNLFNSQFTIEQSEAFANRVAAEAGDNIEQQIRQAWRRALSRDPSAEELAEMQPVVIAYGLAPVCRALFNSNEFLFLP